MSVNEILQSVYQLSIEEKKELAKKLNENIEDPMLQIDPYYYERKEHIAKTIKDIDSGKMKMYDFDDSMDELIQELES